MASKGFGPQLRVTGSQSVFRQGGSGNNLPAGELGAQLSWEKAMKNGMKRENDQTLLAAGALVIAGLMMDTAFIAIRDVSIGQLIGGEDSRI